MIYHIEGLVNVLSYVKEMSRPAIKGDKSILSLSRSREIYVTRYHVRNRSQPSWIVHNQNGRHNQGHKI